MESSKVTLTGDFVLDSSVVIKWFCQEENTKSALEFREGYTKGNVNIAFPDLLIYEIANALRYNKTLNQKDVRDSVNSIIDLGMDIIVPTKKVVESAISIAFEYSITIYDAYFVALAEELRFKFVTSDEHLYDKVKKLDFVQLLKDIDI